MQNLKDLFIPSGAIKITLRDAKTGKIKSVDNVENLITDAGKTAMAAALRGLTTGNKGIITYCAVGTDATAPDAADTILGTELFRKTISVRSNTANAALFEIYFTTEEANGTLREAGLFGDDASDTADTGTLFAHAAINRTKTSNDTLSIAWTVTIG